jgi:hypothetical protein
MEARMSILFFGKKTKNESHQTAIYLHAYYDRWPTAKMVWHRQRTHTLVEVFTHHNELLKVLIDWEKLSS